MKTLLLIHAYPEDGCSATGGVTSVLHTPPNRAD
jgi:hypothetical protein